MSTKQRLAQVGGPDIQARGLDTRPPPEDASEHSTTYDWCVRALGCWDVAIVGGGASGTLLAVHLLRSARGPLHVALVERSARAGLGLAYSTTSPCHLLNVPAARMGAFADDPEHFLRWVRRELPDTAPGAFISRQRYGRYLESVLREARAQAAPGVHLEVVTGDVASVEETDDGTVRVALASEGQVEARTVVLALGNALPSNPRVPDGGLYASRRYHRSPWAQDALRGVSADDDVLLIGTGLTMVDTVLSLVEQGHQGHIHALSRHGLLPHVHQETLQAGATAHASPGLREALRALRQEVRRERGDVSATGTRPTPVRIRAILHLLRREVRRAAEAGADWRTVVDALRPVTIPLWQRLPVDERQRFLRHLRAYWDVHRHRMAPGIGETVERLRRQGRLTLQAARIQGFALEASGVEVRVRRRGQGGEEALRVQHVINCTGPEGAMTRGHPVLCGLVETGRARSDALGMGLATDADGALLDAGGRASGRLYTLGPPRRGELWETTAVPEIRGQARELAGHLLQRLTSTRAPAPVMEAAGAPLGG
ncbi:FAD/NAD(P)-binding protein [Myxococcus sp. SDU36]|uniref:FAD/NAD(P)-binding protein n=1 Tax=Myxococcus sp. SDU36 TaxID=2831967 RepID=UPI0025432DCC|nr:FAD/NAD(P)-binding protein [Myxococcus sp. SDU36]